MSITNCPSPHDLPLYLQQKWSRYRDMMLMDNDTWRILDEAATRMARHHMAFSEECEAEAEKVAEKLEPEIFRMFCATYGIDEEEQNMTKGNNYVR